MHFLTSDVRLLGTDPGASTMWGWGASWDWVLPGAVSAAGRPDSRLLTRTHRKGLKRVVSELDTAEMFE